jgi:antitoxin (DNA-binding transcriptional repressor) of toxin-antitoxin stability system
MARLDLDDLPPRVAAVLAALPPGEELLLVQHGAVVGRLAAVAPPPAPEPQPEPDPDQRAHEVFENFRAAIEDDF